MYASKPSRSDVQEMLALIRNFINTKQYLEKDKCIFKSLRCELLIIFTYNPKSPKRKFVFEYKNKWLSLEELERILLFETMVE